MNPYTPGAGHTPPFLAGHDESIRNFEITLRRLLIGQHEQDIAIYGPMGSGKTVLMEALTDKADELGVRSFEIHPSFIQESVMLLAREELGEDQSFEDTTELLVRVGNEAKARGEAILLTIENSDLASDDDLRSLIIALHRISQKRLPVLCALTGPEDTPGRLGNLRDYSEMLFRFIHTGKLSDKDTRKAFMEPAKAHGVNITDKALSEMVRWSENAPYLIQKVGHDVWETRDGDVIDEGALARAEQKELAEISANT